MESKSKVKKASTNWAKRMLSISGNVWFAIAFIGQWVFAYYIIFFYAPPAIEGQFEAWNKVMPHGYVPGDLMGNVIVGLHLLPAIILLIGGPLQIIPTIRLYAPRFHRINGKIYLTTAFIVSLGGLYMVWIRGAVGDFYGHLAISTNAFFIMIFAAMAWRTALRRQFSLHFQWVLRLFLVVSGVWFFRVGMMLWLFIHKAPVGFDPDTVSGPFITFLTFGQFLIPLAILELYFFVRQRGSVLMKWGAALFVFLLSLITGLGAFLATMGMWLPRL